MSTDFSGGGSIDTSNVEHDGSIENAAILMPDLDDDEGLGQPQQRQPQKQQQNRANDGKYAEGFEDQAAEAQADEQAEPEEREEANDLDDEEWIEFPAEKEGEKPTRLKAADVVRGYQEAQQLREALEQMSRVVPPPPQYDEEIIQTARVRHQMVQQLQQLMALNRPMEPDLELINDRSEKYNPAEYHRQQAFFRQQNERIQQMQSRLQYEQQAMQQEQEALTAARKAREQSKLLQFWPELRDPVVQRTVKDEAARYYGIDDNVISSVLDARFYAILRDALAHRQGMKQRQQAVKVVRAKPKLVRGAARDPSGPKSAQYNASMKRLQQTGSVEDAAAVIGGLI